MIFIDFEYNTTTEARLNLVACSLFDSDKDQHLNFWLDKRVDNDRQELKELLLKYRDTKQIFVAFNVVAEASSFVALGINPTKCLWFDLQQEFKMLCNHWNKYRYGAQMIEGKKVTTTPPVSKWEVDVKGSNHSKPPVNLVGAMYKMLGITLDAKHKDEMRDLIISNPDSYSAIEKKDIMSYCSDDVKYLPKLYEACLASLNWSSIRKFKSKFKAEMLLRGETGARTALMACLGYPVDKESLVNFSNSVPSILQDIAVDINKQFPEEEEEVFVWNKARGTYTKKAAPQIAWIEKQKVASKWRRTPKDAYSLSLDAYMDHFPFSHEYPRNNFAAQIVRYLKTKQSLNGFLPNSKKNIFHSLGSDSRVRAWLNPYGSQTSRFQPSATSFIPLKAAWMRSLIRPKGGKLIASIDYGSEEFLLSALLSRDKNMYNAYVSGDPYFHTAKLAKAVPEDAQRKDHEEVRLRFKSTTLGISYLMGAHGLSNKITQDTGEETTPDQAQNLIDIFFNVYSCYKGFLDKVVEDYDRLGYCRLPDGWTLFGDNNNFRSVSNFPIQGMGAVILRKAIALCQDAGLKVLYPLHDALYIEFKEGDFSPVDTLYECMKEAFCFYFKDEQNKWANSIRMDIDVWGDSLSNKNYTTPKQRSFKGQTIYIDPRSKREYSRFSKYFIRSK